MLSKFNKKVRKRLADVKMRVDGTYWERIKSLEKIFVSYEQTNSTKGEQIDPFIQHIKNEIRREKAYFFFSKTLARVFYPPTGHNAWYASLMESSEQEDCRVFEDVRLPLPINEVDRALMNAESMDIIVPYLLGDPTTGVRLIALWQSEASYESEGPYEVDENVCLRKDDIVIDAGANMGLFSAVASAKGCKVYSFEPSSYIIENYLSKTAALNNNINICQYALWDSEAVLDFAVNYENLGGSRVVKDDAPENSSKVQAIKLDDFVAGNNLPRVDFIKSDIEGAERNMLRGASEVLKEFAPKLSICTYHLPDDPKVIREIILDANPKYEITQGVHKLYAYVP